MDGTLHTAIRESCLQLEGSVSCLVAVGIGTILVMPENTNIIYFLLDASQLFFFITHTSTSQTASLVNKFKGTVA